MKPSNGILAALLAFGLGAGHPPPSIAAPENHFGGALPVDRYQAATAVERVLGHLEAASDPAATRTGRDLSARRRQLDELRGRVETVDTDADELRSTLDRLKLGRTPDGDPRSPGTRFGGLVSVALLGTDDGLPTVLGPGGVTPARTRYALAGAQTAFTLPQASLSVDRRWRHGLAVHLQLDYATDALNPGFAGVGLNEAFVQVEELLPHVEAKFGSFALPFQSWEISGPYRTSQATITPSAVNTFLEGIRVQGLELSEARAGEHGGVHPRLGVFTGADFPLAGPTPNLGALSDGAGLQAVTASGTLDGAFGGYLDLEVAPPGRGWGARASFLNLGGDRSGLPPLTRSFELDGWQVGAWWEGDRLRLQGQHLRTDTDPGAVGVASEHRAWYLLARYQLRPRTHVSLRYDDWRNVLSTAPATGTDGDAFTVAVNRRIGARSLLQLEWLHPDEETLGGAPGAQAADFQDDLLQLRFKVWF